MRVGWWASSLGADPHPFTPGRPLSPSCAQALSHREREAVSLPRDLAEVGDLAHDVADLAQQLQTVFAFGGDVGVDQNVVEEAVLADQLGLDHFNVGEHHRDDFAISSPETVLAGIATRTSRIILGSGVTVLSSADPVRVYQRFATLNALSHGRAEIVAGRGSFIESFPLFGYDLSDYDELYDEKIRLLVQIRDQAIVHFKGHHRPPIDGLGIYPRTVIWATN
jgi:alkanesulfonate monooxygenase SsuD/methylene tetrahydromethanopterin reductase-like flavin-dependent oxidoreductase (luciferase family)